jgi:hypothetical protein
LTHLPPYWKYISKNNLASKYKRTGYQENRRLAANTLHTAQSGETYKYHTCMKAAWTITEVVSVTVPAPGHFSSGVKLNLTLHYFEFLFSKPIFIS